MYESPIVTYMQEMHNQIMNERENAITAQISESIGVDVDKDELIKALQYDRQQYDKGYADAKVRYESMLNEIREDVEHIEVWGCFPDGKSAYIRSGEHIKNIVIEIIDNYKDGMVQ